MTATTIAEMRLAAQEISADVNIAAWAFEGAATWTEPDGAPKSVVCKLRLRSDLKFAGRKTENVEIVEVYLRRDEAHATQPGVERLVSKSELTLADGRVYTFHDKVLWENPVRRIIEMTRVLLVNAGRK